MPTNVDNTRRQRAFNEGRRAAVEKVTINPYTNDILARLWTQGHLQQSTGQLKMPIPPREPGQSAPFRPEQVIKRTPRLDPRNQNYGSSVNHPKFGRSRSNSRIFRSSRR